jgi:(1->4)-alpha-D-glucan 1-alpha-D-glucosylmutase
VASDDINYRRFFDTNDLAGICMENEKVFEATHRLVLRLMAEGKVNGLRIDHPDGLYDPASILRTPQSRCRRYEHFRDRNPGTKRTMWSSRKSLRAQERLPAEWPVCGTTGYDFANLVNGVC